MTFANNLDPDEAPQGFLWDPNCLTFRLYISKKMGGNNDFIFNFERNKYLKKLPSMQRVNMSYATTHLTCTEFRHCNNGFYGIRKGILATSALCFHTENERKIHLLEWQHIRWGWKSVIHPIRSISSCDGVPQPVQYVCRCFHFHMVAWPLSCCKNDVW